MRIATTVVCALALSPALVLSTHLNARAADPGLTLNVVVSDRSTAGGAALGTARTRADYVFADVGIRIAWMTPGQTPAIANLGERYIQLVVTDGARVDQGVPTRDPILGFAVPSANRVYVYYDRVETLALRRNIQPGWFLGVVIAHELTHVLLPESGHTPTGVMASVLAPDPKEPLTFTADEGRAMRARLSGETTLARLGIR